jgi:hypothetical protein
MKHFYILNIDALTNASINQMNGQDSPMEIYKIIKLTEHCFVKTIRNGFPIDDIMKSGYVIRSFILILQIIGMFPNIEPKYGCSSHFGDSSHEWIILIGCGRNEKAFIFGNTKPNPSRPKNAFSGIVEFFFEFIMATKFCIDRGR